MPPHDAVYRLPWPEGQSQRFIHAKGANPHFQQSDLHAVDIGLPEGTSILVSGQSYFITYLGGDGNDIVLTVPEPGNVALMVIGGALMGWQVIRRRRNSRS